jgi:hypothetical protein
MRRYSRPGPPGVTAARVIGECDAHDGLRRISPTRRNANGVPAQPAPMPLIGKVEQRQDRRSSPGSLEPPCAICLRSPRASGGGGGHRMGEPHRIVASELRHVDVRPLGERRHDCQHCETATRRPHCAVIAVDGEPSAVVENDPLGRRRATSVAYFTDAVALAGPHRELCRRTRMPSSACAASALRSAICELNHDLLRS